MDGLSWFDTENESLPSLLVKAGFEVWLGNDRGTANSQRHKSLKADTDAKKFYNYSFAELGKFDYPAALNYINERSNGA